jgi:hypothetical protein
MSFNGIRLRRPNPDGLDPVYEAHALLRDLFSRGKVVQDDCFYEDGSYAGSQEWLVLPTGDAYPADDSNPLDELEYWLSEQLGKQLGESTDE